MLPTYLSLIVTTFFWGGTFIAGRILGEHVAPANAAFVRFFIASICLIFLIIFKEKRFTFPEKKMWLPLFFLGCTGVFFYNVCFFTGLKHIGAGRASLFIASTPLVITILSLLFKTEKITKWKIWGVMVSLVGAVTVITNGAPLKMFHDSFGLGEVSLMGCVLSWSAYTLMGKEVLKELSPLSAVCYSSCIGTLLLFPLALYSNLFSVVPDFTGTDWLSLLFLGIFGTAIGFSLYYAGVEKLGASRAGIFINLVPVFSLLLSWLLLGETQSPTVLLGGALVLCGIRLANYTPKSRSL